MCDSLDIPEYFEYDKKSYKVAKAAVSKMQRETSVLEYLIESQPPFLKVGNSMLGIDKQQLENQMHGVADKLTIHCYQERGDRLRYLYGILTKKLTGNDDLLKMMVQFLIQMSQRPTSLLQLTVEDYKYSEIQDDCMSDEGDSLRTKELLKEILGDVSGLDEGDNITISYSSDSELSDWSSGDESQKPEVSTTKVTSLASLVKPSHSFSDFSAIKLPPDEETKRLEMKEHWKAESDKARGLWKNKCNNSTSLVPLQNQPVITGLLALHSKFGEYWEWKHDTHQSQRLIIPEKILIREILWQFSILSAESSQVFNSDWRLKPGIMTSSLSCKSLSSFMLPLQKTLHSMHILKMFVHKVYKASTTVASHQVAKSPVPPILLSYAQGLADILNFISESVEKLEMSIKKANKSPTNEQTQRQLPVITTLVQLMTKLEPNIECVEMLHDLHTSNFETLNEPSSPSTFASEKDAVSCLNVFYSLFRTLNVQRHPINFGFAQYLFLQCLQAFLEEINSSLTLNWNEHLLFERFPEVKISDPNFWTECIRRREYQSINASNYSIFSVSFFNKLIEEVMVVLKTSEMIRQLDEDNVKIIGHPPDAKKMVKDFLNTIFQPLEEDSPSIDPEELILNPDYEKYINFIGLKNSLESDSVKLILEELRKNRQRLKKDDGKDSMPKISDYKWLFNLSIKQVPTMNSWHALETILYKWYNPLCSKANLCIHKIFEDYSVDQSLQLFREIILETREDFAQSLIALVSTNVKSSRYKWREASCRNPAFQKLLADCYPEGRDNFDIDLKLEMDSTLDTNYTLVVTPRFPLNLVLFEDSIEGYRFVARQLSRIRKSLWEISALNMKDFKPTAEGVEPHRMLLFRFAFLHFCSSLRAYLVCRVFVKDVNFCTTNINNEVDLIRRVHGGHLKTIEVELLKNPVMEKLILRKMGEMSEILGKVWHIGVSIRTMILLEDTLKKCWSAILSFRRNSSDFNELAHHFGPIPSCLS
ncbi:uncharacterized protein LOC110847753 isoform X2 [Folsomia candida]|nr:uncharacterized protein LOC110847753 isoform X2 [Folsomia candida]